MRIIDYQTNRKLNDVEICLDKQEVEELIIYLRRLVENPELHCVHLTEISGNCLERELTVSLDESSVLLPIAA